MNSRTGTFAQVAKQTGTVLDQLGARIVAAVTASNKLGTSTTQLSGFWRQAVIDVSKLGDSIGNLFGIFGNLFKAIPGFAAELLSLGDGFTKILENASAALVPVIKWTLLLHGYILYTGLAFSATLAFIGGLANLARQFVTFAASSVLAGIGALKAFGSALVSIGLALAAYVESIIVADGASASFAAALAPLAANPMIWVTAAALALGALVVAIVRSKDAAQSFNDTMQQTIANAQLSSVVSTIQQAQEVTAARLASTTRDLNTAIRENTVVNAGRAGALNSNGTAIQNLDNTSRHYAEGLGQLDAQQRLVTGRFGELSKAYGGNTQALGLLNAAGITTAQITDTNKNKWAQALIQVESTVRAYQVMGTQAGTLGNDLDALGRTLTDQYKAVQTLNQGWSAFIADVTGTQGAFDTVAQGFSTLQDHSGKLTLSLGKLKATYADSAAGIALQGRVASATAAVASAQNSLNKLQQSGTGTALQLTAAHARLAGAQARLTVAQQNLSAAQVQGKAAIDSLTPAGIALNQAFSNQVVNIDKLFASWRTAGLAANLFTAGVKDAIAPMVRYAAGSQEATAQLVALAQEAGYQGPISMKALTHWLGNTKDATQQLKDITNQATEQEALLTGAMQNQGNFIANKLLGDINAAILAYSGVEKKATAYGRAVAQFGKDSTQAKAAQQTLIAGLIASGEAAGGTTAQIAALIVKITGIPRSQALADIAATMGQAAAATAKSLPAFRQVTADLASQRKAATIANTALSTLNNAIRANGLFSDAAVRARVNLIEDLIRAGVKSTIASADVDKYTQAVRQNGLYSDQASKARKKLIQDIIDASDNSKKGKTDLTNFTNAVRDNGSKSDAAKSARKQLIDDLVNAGLSAKGARTLVNNLQTSIDAMHGKTVKVNFVGSGSGSIAFKESIPGVTLGPSSGGLLGFHAAGGMIKGGSPGKDSVLGMLMPGEVVVPTKMVNQGAVDHLRGKLPGFSAGGQVGKLPGGGDYSVSGMFGPGGIISAGQAYMGKTEAAFGQRVEAAFAAAVIKKFKADMNALAGGGPAIVSYARSFLGKIPTPSAGPD